MRTSPVVYRLVPVLVALALIPLAAAAAPATPPDLVDVRVSVRPLDLTRPPTTPELMAAGQLGGPLHPTRELRDKARERRVNLDFGRAIQAWNDHAYPRAVTLFRKHLERFPDSPWAAEAKLHIGCDAQYQGRYREAREAFEGLIREHKGSPHPGARMMVNKTRLRLGGLEVLQYDFAAATEQFRLLKAESPDWRHRTYASHWIRLLSQYRANESVLLTCGTDALARLLDARGQSVPAQALRQELPDAKYGQSLEDLILLANRHGQAIQARRMSPADLARVPLPAIVQLAGSASGKSGHYWVVEEARGDLLRLFDPQSGRRFRQSTADFAREWGGVALVASDRADLPGAPLAGVDLSGTRGGCCGAPAREHDLGNPNPVRPDDDCAAPRWRVNVINLNFYASDTPLWFTPPYGPEVRIRLSYNSQSAIAYHEPFGPKWQFGYATYMVIDTGGTVTVFMPDGRRDLYTPDGLGGFTPPPTVHDELVPVGPDRYELRRLDGTVHVYSMPHVADGGLVTQYFLEALRDARGLALTFAYDTDGRLVSITDAPGRITTLSYNAASLVSRVADPFGRAADFEYDADGNLVRITDMGGYSSSFTYDADRYITGIDGARGRWQFRTEPADGIAKWSDAYPPPGEPMWANYRITTTNPIGDSFEYFYYGGCDEYGCAGHSWYVGPSDYIPWRSPEINTYTSRVPRTDYVPTVTAGGRGAIAEIRSPEGRRTNFSYDAAGNVESITDGAGHRSSYTYGPRGRLLTATSPSGAVTTYSYAPNGFDVVARTDDLGTTSFSYNAAREVTSITDRLNRTRSFTYNGHGQRVSIRDEAGVTTEFAYGGGRGPETATRGGQVLFRRTHDASGRIATHTEATGLTVSVERDNLDRITRLTFPDGLFRQFTYAGCCLTPLASRTERSGRATRYVYDALQRLVEIRYPDDAVVRLRYDRNGNLTGVVDRAGRVTRYEHDLDNHLTRRVFADGGAESYRSDADGLISEVSNARGQTRFYTYSALHRVTRMSTAGEQDVLYTYDAFGRATSRQDAVGLTRFVTDAESQLREIDGPWADDTVRITHDATGRRTRIAVDGGTPMNYTYDIHGRIATVTSAGGTFTYAFAGPSPLPESVTGPQGVTTTFAYDPLDRLTETLNRRSDLSLIARYGYAHDADGRRTTIDIEDALSASPPPGRMTVSEFNGVDQLLSSTDPMRSYTYDADGNQTRAYVPSGEPATAAYDPWQRLASIEYAAAGGHLRRTEHTYDADGLLARLVERDDNLVSRDRRFVRLAGLVLQERDGGNGVMAELTWGREFGGGIGGLLSRTSAGSSYSYVYDGRGNVVAVVDASGALVAAYRYDPFGNVRARLGPVSDERRFSTKPYDERTGLSDFGFRHYAPQLGRWLTRDPAGERDGPQLYAFVGNDPVNRVDPWGLQSGAPGADDPFPPGTSVGPIEQPGGENLWAGRDDEGNWWTRVCDGGACETYVCDAQGTGWFGSLAMDYACSPGPCTPQQRVTLTDEINDPGISLGTPTIGKCLDADCTVIAWF